MVYTSFRETIHNTQGFVVHIAATLPLYESYLPIALLILIALGFAAGTIVMSTWLLPTFLKKLKPHQPTEVKNAPYECGIPAEGEPRGLFFVRFYQVALLFLLFEMEIIYIVIWALIFRGALDSPAALTFLLLEMGMFVGVLLVGYVYAWKKGALTWS